MTTSIYTSTKKAQAPSIIDFEKGGACNVYHHDSQNSYINL